MIFDLDDTLVDTSGCITPVKLQHALGRMVESGLSIPHFETALEVIKRLNDSAESAKNALAEFLELIGADKRFLEIGAQEVYQNISDEIPIFPIEHAIEVLKDLSESHQLALVTFGREPLQLMKLKKAGIDSTFFSKIVVSEEPTKKLHYQMIVEELGFAPAKVIVCGDRISRDLAPARELGFKTVHIRSGRGRNCFGMSGDVDHQISRLIEIKEIIKNYE